MNDHPQSRLSPKEADKVSLPSELDFPAFLMNFPFTVDNRADNNALMEEGAEPYNKQKAFTQFMGLYSAIAKDALVYILPSGGDYQDLPYVANLGMCPPEKPEIMLLSNYTSPPRKGEDKVGMAFFEQMGFDVRQSPAHWEGEADIKFIRKGVYAAGYGQRSEAKAFDWIAKQTGAEVTQVKLSDPKLYHFDCSFFPMGGDEALVAVSALDPADVRKLEAIVDIVEVPKQFVYDGWTNSVRLGERLLHADSGKQSNAAFAKLISRYGFDLEIIPLDEFHKSGADLSCLIMHMNFMGRTHQKPMKRRSSLLYKAENIQIKDRPIDARGN